VGGLIGTLVMGYVAQAFSFGAAWSIAGLVLMLSALAYFVIPTQQGSLDKDGI
jgi:hypothetical protein